MFIEHPGMNIVKSLNSATEPQINHRKTDIYNQYGQYQRYRQMSLDDMLLENRIVFLIGEISYQRAAEVIMKMLYLDNLKRNTEISLYKLAGRQRGRYNGNLRYNTFRRLTDCYLLHWQSPVRRRSNTGSRNEG